VSKYKELILYAYVIDNLHRQFANIMRLTYLTVLHIIMRKVSSNIEINVIIILTLMLVMSVPII